MLIEVIVVAIQVAIAVALVVVVLETVVEAMGGLVIVVGSFRGSSYSSSSGGGIE